MHDVFPQNRFFLIDRYQAFQTFLARANVRIRELVCDSLLNVFASNALMSLPIVVHANELLDDVVLLVLNVDSLETARPFEPNPKTRHDPNLMNVEENAMNQHHSHP